MRNVAEIDLEIDPIPAIPAIAMKIQLDQDQLHAASSPARANVSTLLRELGKNAYDAGARVVDVAMDRDSTGRLVSIRCRHDGAALSSEALESFLRAGIRHEVPVDRTKLGEFGLGLLSLGSFCDRLEFHDAGSEGEPFALRIDREQNSASIETAPPRRLVGRGPPLTIALSHLSPDLVDARADVALESLPLSPEFRVFLDDIEGRVEVRPRSYDGSLLDRGKLQITWKAEDAVHSSDCAYEFRLAKSRSRKRGRPAAQGIHIVRNGMVVDSSTFDIPVRRSEVGQLVGWIAAGDWLKLDPVTTRPAGRQNSARAFRSAAKNLIAAVLSDVSSTPAFLSPGYLSKLGSELTQRFSKAVNFQPELAPVLDLDAPIGRHRKVLDIGFRSPHDDPTSALRSLARGIRVRFDLGMSPSGYPASWDADKLEIVINARHNSVARLANGPSAFEVWAAGLVGQMLANMRPGRAANIAALNDAGRLIDVAYSTASMPTSTRSQRERRIRTDSQQRLKQQVGAGS